MNDHYTDNQGRTVIVKEVRKKSNGIGVSGFVLSLVAIMIGWIPVIGWAIGGLLWFLGLIFSFIGIFKRPRGLALAGLIISVIIGVLLIYIFRGPQQFETWMQQIQSL